MLLGREPELDEIRAALGRARSGDSALLVLAGEPGIGKSALLEAAVDEAQDMTVLRARGVPTERSIPFAALSQLLRPVLGLVDELPAPQAAALEGALALRPVRGRGRLAVGAATLGVLAAAAEQQPVLVVVDDAHWLDPSSAEALRFAARRLLADAVAVIVAWRLGEGQLLGELGEPALELSGLDLEAGAALLSERGTPVDAATARRLHRATAGNPLGMLELARAGDVPATPLDTPTPMPTQLSDAYLVRAAELPSATQTALLAAAALDNPQLRVLARALAALGVHVDDLGPAEEAGLLVARGGRLEVRHPLVRSAVYGAGSATERRAVHRAIADALPDSEADRRAWHLWLAASGPDAGSSSALEQAGARARLRGADDEASLAFERAAELQSDDERRAALLLEAADAAWLAGDHRRAGALLDGLGELDDQPTLRVAARHLRGRIALRNGPIDTGRALLVEAARDAAAHDPDLAVVMLAEAAEGAFFAADAAGMAACARQARAVAEHGAGEGAAFFTAAAAGMADVLAGRPTGAAEIRAAVGLVNRAGALTEDPRLLAWMALGPLWLREDGAGDALERALAAARERAAAGALPHLLVHVGIAEAAGDQWIRARADLDEAERLARETGQGAVLAQALARSAALDARCGRTEQARREADEALNLARELGARLFELWALTALAELAMTDGDADTALGLLRDVETALAVRRVGDPDLSPTPEHVELLVAAGRRPDAERAAEPFIAAAEAKGQPWALARAHRCRALLAGADEQAENEFAAALEAHDRTADVFQRARTQLLLGARRRRAGQRRLAREPLRAALATFEHLGAHPWSHAAEAELRATGETARRREPSTIDELTPQELRVVLLLAGGRTTREAAATLFLSPKTVEYHQRNAYRKLGVSSRDELREVLD